MMMSMVIHFGVKKKPKTKQGGRGDNKGRNDLPPSLARTDESEADPRRVVMGRAPDHTSFSYGHVQGNDVTVEEKLSWSLHDW